jgi:hypothetical protein
MDRATVERWKKKHKSLRNALRSPNGAGPEVLGVLVSLAERRKDSNFVGEWLKDNPWTCQISASEGVRVARAAQRLSVLDLGFVPDELYDQVFKQIHHVRWKKSTVSSTVNIRANIRAVRIGFVVFCETENGFQRFDRTITGTAGRSQGWKRCIGVSRLRWRRVQKTAGRFRTGKSVSCRVRTPGRGRQSVSRGWSRFEVISHRDREFAVRDSEGFTFSIDLLLL